MEKLLYGCAAVFLREKSFSGNEYVRSQSYMVYFDEKHKKRVQGYVF